MVYIAKRSTAVLGQYEKISGPLTYTSLKNDTQSLLAVQEISHYFHCHYNGRKIEVIGVGFVVPIKFPKSSKTEGTLIS